jgi:hypothetical protein
MKKHLLLSLLLLTLLPAAHAQMGLNSPMGLAPVRDMEIYSRDVFLVQQKYIPTTDPISGTYTLSCATNPPALTASAGVLLDPGGKGIYSPLLNCSQRIIAPSTPSSVGYELTFMELDTDASGDSVVIEDIYGGRIAFSGSELPPVLLVSGYLFSVTFKSDFDFSLGSGFALRWRRVSMDTPSTREGDGRFGNSLQFDLRKGALVGGFNVVGTLQQAGNHSTALGNQNKAIGDFAIALGSNNTASGHYSTAIGNFVSTAERGGAMILGDISSPISTSATANNQLTARFAGGYRFFTNRDLTTGVSLAAGGTSWGTISDSTKKERFLPINGPELLRKIGGMKLTTWNYKGQRDRRHYGPMAQEFFALFGHDALGAIGCDTLLTTQDVEGLTLSAVQALVRENEQLRAELVRTKADLSNRLQLLEQAMLGRKREASAGI